MKVRVPGVRKLSNMIERGNPLSGATQGPRQVEDRARSKHVLFMKKLLNMIERGHPLSAVTQIRSQELPKHVPLMKAQTSTFKIKQHMIERRNPLLAVTQSHEPGNEQSMLNGVNIDFRIPGLPHSFEKQAQNSRFRESVKKIENHPHRHAFQCDLQQNEAYNPLRRQSK